MPAQLIDSQIADGPLRLIEVRYGHVTTTPGEGEEPDIETLHPGPVVQFYEHPNHLAATYRITDDGQQMTGAEILTALGEPIPEPLPTPAPSDAIGVETVVENGVRSFVYVTGELPVPQSVRPDQARIALILTPAKDGVSANLLAQAEAVFDALPEPEKSIAKTRMEYTVTFRRDAPLIATAKTLLSLTDGQVDDLFRLAEAQ